MTEKPCRLHAALKHPLNLVGRDTFLARAEQMNDLEPEAQRKMRRLENRPHTYRKRLLAGVALTKPDTGGLAGQASDLGLIGVSAIRANRTVLPETLLDVPESRGFALKVNGGRNRRGRSESPMGEILGCEIRYGKCNAATLLRLKGPTPADNRAGP